MNVTYLIVAYLVNCFLFLLGIYGFGEEYKDGFSDVFSLVMALLLIFIPLVSSFILPFIFKKFKSIKNINVNILDESLEEKIVKNKGFYKAVVIINIIFALALFLLASYGIYTVVEEYYNYPSELDEDFLIFPAILLFSIFKTVYYVIFVKKISTN